MIPTKNGEDLGQLHFVNAVGEKARKRD